MSEGEDDLDGRIEVCVRTPTMSQDDAVRINVGAEQPLLSLKEEIIRVFGWHCLPADITLQHEMYSLSDNHASLKKVFGHYTFDDVLIVTPPRTPVTPPRLARGSHGAPASGTSDENHHDEGGRFGWLERQNTFRQGMQGMQKKNMPSVSATQTLPKSFGKIKIIPASLKHSSTEKLLSSPLQSQSVAPIDELKPMQGTVKKKKKKGLFGESWTTRYWSLSSDQLHVFKSKTEFLKGLIKETIQVKDIISCTLSETGHKGRDINRFVILLPARSIEIMCTTPEEAREWVLQIVKNRERIRVRATDPNLNSLRRYSNFFDIKSQQHVKTDAPAGSQHRRRSVEPPSPTSPTAPSSNPLVQPRHSSPLPSKIERPNSLPVTLTPPSSSERSPSPSTAPGPPPRPPPRVKRQQSQEQLNKKLAGLGHELLTVDSSIEQTRRITPDSPAIPPRPSLPPSQPPQPPSLLSSSSQDSPRNRDVSSPLYVTSLNPPTDCIDCRFYGNQLCPQHQVKSGSPINPRGNFVFPPSQHSSSTIESPPIYFPRSASVQVSRSVPPPVPHFNVTTPRGTASPSRPLPPLPPIPRTPTQPKSIFKPSSPPIPPPFLHSQSVSNLHPSHHAHSHSVSHSYQPSQSHPLPLPLPLPNFPGPPLPTTAPPHPHHQGSPTHNKILGNRIHPLPQTPPTPTSRSLPTFSNKSGSPTNKSITKAGSAASPPSLIRAMSNPVTSPPVSRSRYRDLPIKPLLLIFVYAGPSMYITTGFVCRRWKEYTRQIEELLDGSDDEEETEEVGVDDVKNVIIIDNGHYQHKAGFAGKETPQFFFSPSFTEHKGVKKAGELLPKSPPIVSITPPPPAAATLICPSCSAQVPLGKKFCADCGAAIKPPAEQKKDTREKDKTPQTKEVLDITEWEVKEEDYKEYERVWDALFKEMKVDPQAHRVVVTTPILAPKEYEERLLSLLFDKFKVPAVFVEKQPVLTSYCYGYFTALAVDIGHTSCQIAPLVDGSLLEESFFRVSHLSGRYMQLLLEKLVKPKAGLLEIDPESAEFPETIRQVRETMLQVVEDYDEAMHDPSPYSKKLNVPANPPSRKSPVSVTLSKELVMAPELLFQPRLVLQDAEDSFLSVPELIEKCVNSVAIDNREKLLSTIVLSGGVTKIPGLDKRLETELKDRLPHIATKIKVFTNLTNREQLVWSGGSLFASTSEDIRWMDQFSWKERTRTGKK